MPNLASTTPGRATSSKWHIYRLQTVFLADQLCYRQPYFNWCCPCDWPAAAHTAPPGPAGSPAGCFSWLGQSAPAAALSPPQCVRTGRHSEEPSPSHGSAEGVMGKRRTHTKHMTRSVHHSKSVTRETYSFLFLWNGNVILSLAVNLLGKSPFLASQRSGESTLEKII